MVLKEDFMTQVCVKEEKMLPSINIFSKIKCSCDSFRVRYISGRGCYFRSFIFLGDQFLLRLLFLPRLGLMQPLQLFIIS